MLSDLCCTENNPYTTFYLKEIEDTMPNYEKKDTSTRKKLFSVDLFKYECLKIRNTVLTFDLQFTVTGFAEKRDTS